MVKMGFDRGWVNLIIRCVRSVSFTFKLNGGKYDNLIPQRGLHQGPKGSS